MATHQYIGARYVPIYVGAWAANTPYEPLSIVTYNNSSYTSRTAVPDSVGAPDVNPTYWAETGNYNGYIAGLQADVADLKQEAIETIVVFPTFDPSNDPCGTCMAMIHGEHAFLIDMGLYQSFSDAKRALDAYGVKYIDGVIISHFHADHDCLNVGTPLTSWDGWKAAYDFSNCVFYLPLDPPAHITGWNQQTRAAIQAAFPNNTFINPPYVDVSFYDVEMDFYNYTSADYSANDSLGVTSYNGYSTVVYAHTTGGSVLYCADITYYVQRRLAPVFPHADVMLAPHHSVDSHDYSDMIKKVAPTVTYVTNPYPIANSGYAMREPNMFLSKELICNSATYPDVAAGSLSKFTTLAGGRISVHAYSPQSLNHIYVDPTISDLTYQNGSLDFPFKYMALAIAMARENATIHLLNDYTFSPQASTLITGSNGFITIDGDGHALQYVQISMGGRCHFKNTVFNGSIEMASGAWAEFESCTFNQALNILDSTFHSKGCTFAAKVGGNRSYITAYDMRSALSGHVIEVSASCVLGGYNEANVTGTYSDGVVSNNGGYTNMGKNYNTTLFSRAYAHTTDTNWYGFDMSANKPFYMKNDGTTAYLA